MNDTDTSDEAFKEWYDKVAVPNTALLSTYSTAEFARAAWQEATRRAGRLSRETVPPGSERLRRTVKRLKNAKKGNL